MRLDLADTQLDKLEHVETRSHEFLNYIPQKKKTGKRCIQRRKLKVSSNNEWPRHVAGFSPACAFFKRNLISLSLSKLSGPPSPSPLSWCILAIDRTEMKIIQSQKAWIPYTWRKYNCTLNSVNRSHERIRERLESSLSKGGFAERSSSLIRFA